MRVIIETFITIIFLSLTVFVATQVIGAQIVINGANTFHTNAVQLIEESDFDSTVIAECISQAEAEGYILEVTVDKVSMFVCDSCNTMWEVGEVVQCENCKSSNVYEKQISSDGVVTLRYQVGISMLGIEQEGSLQSNAR